MTVGKIKSAAVFVDVRKALTGTDADDASTVLSNQLCIALAVCLVLILYLWRL